MMLGGAFPEGDPRREPLTICEVKENRFTVYGGPLGGVFVILSGGWSVTPNRYFFDYTVFTLESVPDEPSNEVRLEYSLCEQIFTLMVTPTVEPDVVVAPLDTRLTYDNVDQKFLNLTYGFNMVTLTGAGGPGEDSNTDNPGGGGGQSTRYIFYNYNTPQSIIKGGRPDEIGARYTGNAESFMLVSNHYLRAEGGYPAVGVSPGRGGGPFEAIGSGGEGGAGTNFQTCGGGGAGGTIGYGGRGSGFGVGTEDGGDGGATLNQSGAGYGFIVRPPYPNYGLVPYAGESSSVEGDVPPKQPVAGRYGGGGSGKVSSIPILSISAAMGAQGAVHIVRQQLPKN